MHFYVDERAAEGERAEVGEGTIVVVEEGWFLFKFFFFF